MGKKYLENKLSFIKIINIFVINGNIDTKGESEEYDELLEEVETLSKKL